MEIKFSLSLPRDEISIPVVRKICTRALAALGVTRECIDDVEVALSEACANVLRHARADDEYEVSAGVSKEVAIIEVVDHGGGFDVAALSAGTSDLTAEQGRGIQIMRALMDEVKFSVASGPRRETRVQLTKTLVWDESSPGARLALASGRDRLWPGPARERPAAEGLASSVAPGISGGTAPAGGRLDDLNQSLDGQMRR
jgi:serine/threonine-protein kinase RsbW